MADILNRLLLETKDFDAKLSRSKASVNDYSGSVSNMAKMVGEGVMKFAGAIGLAYGGLETFNKVIHSSQGLGDSFDNAINACKETVDLFFQSLSTGDFAAFKNGISSTIKDMEKLSALRDSLGDAKLSMGYNTKVFDAKFTEYESIIRDTTKSKTERENALKSLNTLKDSFKKDVDDTLEGSTQTLIKELNLKSGRKDFNISDIEKYISVNNNDFSTRDEKKRLVEYQTELKKLQAKQYTTVVNSNGKLAGDTHRVENPYITDQIKLLKENNKELEKQNWLNNDNDTSRKGMIQNLEYIQDLKKRGYDFDKRTLELQNSLASSKVANGSGSKTPPPVVGSVADLDKQISEKNKELISATTMQARIAVQTTINELEAKKINLKIATDKGAFAAEHGNNKFDVSNARKNFSQYTDIDKQISVKRKELIGATTEDARKAVLNTINELEAKKFNIRISLEEDVKDRAIDTKSKKSISEYMDIDSRIAEQRTSLINATTDEARKAVQVTIDELKARKIKLSANIDIKPNMSSEIAGVINADTKNKEGNVTTKGAKGFDPKSIKKIKSPVSKSDIKLLGNYQEGLYGIGDAMGFLAGKTNEEAASWLNWGASVLNAVGQAIPAIEKLIPALTAKAGAEAIAQTSGAGPLGWIMAGVAVASILASFASLPKFANGGIIEGGSTFGDMNLARVNSGEMILNRGQQSRLFNVINAGETSRNTEIVNTIASTSIRGKDLILVINNELKSRGKKTL